MADMFVGDSLITAARTAFAITKSDTTNYLTGNGLVVPKALYVGSPGDLVVQLVGDSGTVTFVNVGGGSILPIRPQRVLAATTAANIVGLN
jgi:hypothetical protein